MGTRLWLTGLLIAMSSAVGAPPASGDVAAFKEMMIKTEDLKLDLEDAFTAKSAAKVAKSADEMVKLLVDATQFWTRVQMTDAKRKEQALAAARENLVTAKQLAAHAKAGKLAEARTAYDAMNKQCMACHEPHYEAQFVK